MAAEREKLEEAKGELAERQAAVAAESRRLAEQRLQQLQSAERLWAKQLQLGSQHQQVLPSRVVPLQPQESSELASQLSVPWQLAAESQAAPPPAATPPDVAPPTSKPPSATVEVTGAGAGNEAAAKDSKYRALLSDLQTSIERWQRQLETGGCFILACLLTRVCRGGWAEGHTHPLTTCCRPAAYAALAQVCLLYDLRAGGRALRRTADRRHCSQACDLTFPAGQPQQGSADS